MLPAGVQLSVTSASLGGDPRGWPDATARLGVAGVLIDAVSPAISLPALSHSGRRDFRHQFVSRQLSIAGLRLSLGPNSLARTGDADQAVAVIVKAMDAASGVSAPLVCVELGGLPIAPQTTRPRPAVTQDMAGIILLPNAPPPEPEPSPAPSASDLDAVDHVDAVLAEVAAAADRAGVMLAFRSELASLASLERTVMAARCPWFGIDLDPVALLRDAWPADEAFSRLGSHLRHVRGRDGLRGEGSRTRPVVVGHGNVDWRELLSNLDAAGYRGWLTIDPAELSDRMNAVREARLVFLV